MTFSTSLLPLSHNLSLPPLVNALICVGTVPIISHTWVGSIPICTYIPSPDLHTPNKCSPIPHYNSQQEANGSTLKPASFISNCPPVHPCSARKSGSWLTKQWYAPRPVNHQCHLRNKANSLRAFLVDPINDFFQQKKKIETDISPVMETKGAANPRRPTSNFLPSLASPPHGKFQQSTDLENDSPLKKEAAYPKRTPRRSPLKSAPRISLSSPHNFFIYPKFSLSPSKNQKSILGPHPSTILTHLSSPRSTTLSLNSKISTLYNSHKTSQKMSALTETDEAFIQKFVGLSTEDEIVIVPQQATSSTNWELCLLAQIITDRLVLDGPFESSMIFAWRVGPITSMRQVMKNCYLFEFNSAEDLNSTLLGGVWTYRGDLVALSQVHSDSDLNPALIDTTAVWVLLLNVPVNAFKDEGLLLIAGKVGTPVSAPIKGFVHGRGFIKVKVLIKVGEEVKDKVIASHPTLGQIPVYCAYEKISRICLFCGKLGHEMAGCQDHARLALLAKKPGQESRFKDMNILAPRKGEWIVNPALAPGTSAKRNPTNSKSASDFSASKTGFKRAFEKPEHDGRNFSYNLGLELAGEQNVFEEGSFMLGKGNSDLSLNKRAKSAGHNAPAPHP